MRLSEILRLVWLNLSQNKFKVILTSIGIVVGSATIMLVLAIGTGGKEEVAEQFKNLNAGAIDISCDSSDSGGFSFEMPGGGGSVTVTNMGGGSGGGMSGGPGGGMDFGGFFGFGQEEESEAVTLTCEDGDDLATFVSGISATTISYSTTASVEGGDMTSASYYTIAGVEDNYAAISNLEMAIGDFLTEENNESKEKVCVLGATVAKEIFGSAYDAYDGIVYIDVLQDRQTLLSQHIAFIYIFHGDHCVFHHNPYAFHNLQTLCLWHKFACENLFFTLLLI